MKREPARIAIRKKILQHEKHPIKHPEEGLGKTHPFLVKELKKPISLQKVPGYFPTKEDWERAIKRVVASKEGRKKGKTQRTSKASKHQSSRQEGDPPEERPSQPPRMGQGAGGGGGDDPGDPDEPDDSGLGDGQDEEDEDETETETEGEVPQEELPQSLRGQTVHRIRIPTKLMGSSSHKARRFNKPTRRGGGGNSPSPSPPLVEEVMKGGKEKYLKDLGGSIWYKDLQDLLDKMAEMAEMVLMHHLCLPPMTNSKYYYQFGHLCFRTVI